MRNQEKQKIKNFKIH